MSALTKIKAMRHAFTQNEQQIAEYLQRHSDKVRELSSQQLANEIGVSQSSIVKFTQKLGYKGYPALKFALIEGLNSSANEVPLHGQITLNDSLMQVAEKLLNSKHATLGQTSKLNEEQQVNSAVEAILAANRISVCGMGASGLVARDFCYKLQKIGKAASAESSGHLQLAYVASFTEQDLVVCISESGTTKEIIAVAELAAKQGAKVITITCFGKNPLMKIGDIHLFTVAESSSLRLSSILSRTSQEFVIDLLFIAATQYSAESRVLVGKSNQAVRQFIG